MNAFQRAVNDIFNCEDFLESCIIDGVKYYCICSKMSDQNEYTDAGLVFDVDFTLDLKLPLPKPVKNDAKVQFRGKQYRVSRVEVDSRTCFCQNPSSNFVCIMSSVKFTFDDSTFVKNVKEVSDRLHQQMAETIKEMTKTFTNVAAEYTPPWPKGSIRESRIAKQFITRKIVDLANQCYVNADGSYQLDRIDNMMLYGKKMKYKVIFDKKGLARRDKSESIYTKSLSAAKRLARVHNRGLARAMWGKNIGTIGKAFGAAIRDALKAMGSSADYNSITFREDENIVEVSIDNGATSVRSGVLQSAADKAWEKTKQRFDYILKALVDKDKNL